MTRHASLLGCALAVAVLAAASPAPAYVYNTLDFVNGSAVVAHWPEAAFPLRFYVTRGLTDDVGDGSDRAALEAALATWSGIADATVQLELAGERDVEANVFDGINAIEFSNDDALQGAGFVALTFLTTAADGTILEADILVNDRAVGFTTTAGDRVGLDLETVLLREIGRALGLANSPVGTRDADGTLSDGTAVMFPVSRGIGEAARSLTDDDVAAIASLYPAAGSDRAAIIGTVHRGGEPVFGAHVLAFDPLQQILVGALTLPDGTFRIGGLPPGRYFVEAQPLTQPATAATIGGIFDSTLVDASFRRTFFAGTLRLEAGGTAAGVALEVQ